MLLLEFSEWQWPPCSAERKRARRSGTGPKLLRIAPRKRREERGEVGLVLVRLVIGAWRIGGDEAGEINGFTVVAVALIWSGDEVTAAPRFIIVIRQGRFPRNHD